MDRRDALRRSFALWLCLFILTGWMPSRGGGSFSTAGHPTAGGPTGIITSTSFAGNVWTSRPQDATSSGLSCTAPCWLRLDAGQAGCTPSGVSGNDDPCAVEVLYASQPGPWYVGGTVNYASKAWKTHENGLLLSWSCSGASCPSGYWHTESGTDYWPKSVAFGPISDWLFETAGDATITLKVIDRETGYTHETLTFDYSVADPDVTYAGGDTVCVYRTTAGTCPASGSTYQQSDGDWVAAANANDGTGKRILFLASDTWSSTSCPYTQAFTGSALSSYGGGHADLRCANEAAILKTASGTLGFKWHDLDFSYSAQFTANSQAQYFYDQDQSTNDVLIANATYQGAARTLDQLLFSQWQDFDQNGPSVYGAFPDGLGIFNVTVTEICDINVIFTITENLALYGSTIMGSSRGGSCTSGEHAFRHMATWKTVVAHNHMGGIDAGRAIINFRSMAPDPTTDPKLASPVTNGSRRWMVAGQYGFDGYTIGNNLNLAHRLSGTTTITAVGLGGTTTDWPSTNARDLTASWNRIYCDPTEDTDSDGCYTRTILDVNGANSSDTRRVRVEGNVLELEGDSHPGGGRLFTGEGESNQVVVGNTTKYTNKGVTGTAFSTAYQCDGPGTYVAGNYIWGSQGPLTGTNGIDCTPSYNLTNRGEVGSSPTCFSASAAVPALRADFAITPASACDGAGTDLYGLVDVKGECRDPTAVSQGGSEPNTIACP